MVSLMLIGKVLNQKQMYISLINPLQYHPMREQTCLIYSFRKKIHQDKWCFFSIFVFESHKQKLSEEKVLNRYLQVPFNLLLMVQKSCTTRMYQKHVNNGISITNLNWWTPDFWTIKSTTPWSHGPYSDTSGGNSEEDSSLSSWHFGTSFLGPIRWWLVGGKKLVGIPFRKWTRQWNITILNRRYIHCHVRCRGRRSLYAKTSAWCLFWCVFCCFGVDVFYEKIRKGCKGMKQRFVWHIQVLMCRIFLFIEIYIHIYGLIDCI